MLILIMFFLYRMQSGPAIDWRVHTFGYLASVGLIVAVILNLRGRMKKDLPQHQHSHESDWMFLYLLLWVAVTGVAADLLHRSGAEEAANVMYIIHLMGVVPMLVLEVPFGKWAHLAYRPLAVYFGRVQLHAEETEAARAAEGRASRLSRGTAAGDPGRGRPGRLRRQRPATARAVAGRSSCAPGERGRPGGTGQRNASAPATAFWGRRLLGRRPMATSATSLAGDSTRRSSPAAPRPRWARRSSRPRNPSRAPKW